MVLLVTFASAKEDTFPRVKVKEPVLTKQVVEMVFDEVSCGKASLIVSQDFEAHIPLDENQKLLLDQLYITGRSQLKFEKSVFECGRVVIKRVPLEAQ